MHAITSITKISLRTRILASAAIIAVTGGVAAAMVATASPQPLTQSTNTAAHSAAPATPSQQSTKARRHPLLAALVAATVKETGTPATTIRQDLKSGQTLAAIAGSKAASVETDVLNRLQARLDKAVQRGRITKEREQDLLAKAKTRVEHLMNAKLPHRSATA